MEALATERHSVAAGRAAVGGKAIDSATVERTDRREDPPRSMRRPPGDPARRLDVGAPIR
ncbi:MAG: hypothetical protein HS111_05510 [Kofleriaceae bacterium]|nr:hypothetical protein [Kofleriaceae bacterium]